ncbi:hypothetical protein JCM3770_004970 [Rhodotorula araucariae]
MSAPHLSAAFASLAQSSAALRSFRFEQTAVLPRTVLSSEEFFETHLIRDAAPHELALFEPAAATNDVLPLDADEVAQMGLANGQLDDKWMAIKRKGPRRAGGQRDRASPLRERRATQAGHSGGPDPDRCLRAAQKLLDVYTMPRAQEHVAALQSQYAGLVDTINSLEEALRRPPSRSAPQPQHDASYYRQLELEDAIKREQLEIFALEQLKAEKEAEAGALYSPVRAPRSTPSDAPSVAAASARGSRVPSVVARARGGSTARPRTSHPRPSASPERTYAPTVPPAASTVLAQHRAAEHVLASPARRPIGADARAKARASLMAGRPSVGTRPSVGGARASNGGRSSLGGSALPAAATDDENDGEATPKAVRTAIQPQRVSPSPSPLSSPRKLAPPVPAVVGDARSPSKPAKAQRASLPAGVTPAELASAAATIWATLGEVNALTAWGRKWAREQAGGEAEKEQRVANGQCGWEETLAILQYALASAASSEAAGPSSPSSHSVTSFSTSTTGGAGEGDAAPTWTPAQVVEAQLCAILLSVLSGSPPSSPAPLPPLPIILRDSLLGSTRKTPHLAMAALKAHLGAFAKDRGWTEEMGTTAIYALVSKQTVKTDRRGREGAAVAFKVVDAV